MQHHVALIILGDITLIYVCYKTDDAAHVERPAGLLGPSEPGATRLAALIDHPEKVRLLRLKTSCIKRLISTLRLHIEPIGAKKRAQ